MEASICSSAAWSGPAKRGASGTAPMASSKAGSRWPGAAGRWLLKTIWGSIRRVASMLAAKMPRSTWWSQAESTVVQNTWPERRSAGGISAASVGISASRAPKQSDEKRAPEVWSKKPVVIGLSNAGGLYAVTARCPKVADSPVLRKHTRSIGSLRSLSRSLADPGFVARERRVFLLPVYVAACVAVGDDQAAADGLAQLEELARRFGTAGPAASAAVARGRVSLHRGDTEAAIAALQDGVRIWNEIEAPYEAAQTRVLLARALTAEGDSAGARLELKAAARLVEEFGVAVDLNIRALDGSGVPLAARELGLTARELEVLALVSEGRTNRQIADSLYIAVKTASAHVSSLLLKLGVANRSEAGAAARRLDLN